MGAPAFAYFINCLTFITIMYLSFMKVPLSFVNMSATMFLSAVVAAAAFQSLLL